MEEAAILHLCNWVGHTLERDDDSKVDKEGDRRILERRSYKEMWTTSSETAGKMEAVE